MSSTCKNLFHQKSSSLYVFQRSVNSQTIISSNEIFLPFLKINNINMKVSPSHASFDFANTILGKLAC